MLLSRAAGADLQISRLAGEVRVDGELSEEAWSGAPRVESFVEYFRGDNTAPPVRTTAFLGYDDAAVYVGFVAEDPWPEAIRAPLVDRDRVFGDQDYAAVLIDTQNDRRSGVAFRVNPRGVQTDSVVNDATGEEDFSPDFFYEAVARRTSAGWTAEMRIPLSSLRYPDADPQSWGVILMRNYPRDFRYIMASTRIPKNSGCFLCHAEVVSGFEGLPSGGHVTLTPYSAANVTERQGGVSASGRGIPAGTRRFDSEQGLDVKWNPSTRLTIDATLNPDFSQIEADVPQFSVNSRFALADPEKRAFFLEGIDLLSTPIRAVYTRAITAPAWGLRATGRSDRDAWTLLLTEDRGGGSLILPGPDGSAVAPQDFRSRVAVGRLRRSYGDSFAAFLLSTREVEGGGFNRLAGPDFLWKRNATDKISGQLLFTSTENPDRPDLHGTLNGESFNGHAGRVVFQRDAKRYDLWSAVSTYSPGFRADNGFVVQNGLRRGGLWGGLRSYPKRGLSYLRLYGGVEHDLAFEEGSTLRSGVYNGFYFQGKWGSDGWVTAQLEHERVGNALLPKRFVEFNLRAAPRGWLPSVRLNGIAGEKIDYAGVRVGNGATLNLSATVRATDHLELQAMTMREWLDLSEGRLFSAAIDWMKVTCTFSPRSLVRVVAQRSDIERNPALAAATRPRDRSLSFSGLYAWKLNWQTVFFLGYGDASITGERGDLVREARSVFMKVAYAFQR